MWFKDRIRHTKHCLYFPGAGEIDLKIARILLQI